MTNAQGMDGVRPKDWTRGELSSNVLTRPDMGCHAWRDARRQGRTTSGALLVTSGSRMHGTIVLCKALPMRENPVWENVKSRVRTTGGATQPMVGATVHLLARFRKLHIRAKARSV